MDTSSPLLVRYRCSPGSKIFSRDNTSQEHNILVNKVFSLVKNLLVNCLISHVNRIPLSNSNWQRLQRSSCRVEEPNYQHQFMEINIMDDM